MVQVVKMMGGWVDSVGSRVISDGDEWMAGWTKSRLKLHPPICEMDKKMDFLSFFFHLFNPSLVHIHIMWYVTEGRKGRKYLKLYSNKGFCHSLSLSLLTQSSSRSLTFSSFSISSLLFNTTPTVFILYTWKPPSNLIVLNFLYKNKHCIYYIILLLLSLHP